MSFDEVKDTLEAEIKKFKARQAAVQALEDLIIRSETNPKLADAAASMGLQSETSETFTAAEAPGFFEGDEALIQKAFETQVGKVAQAVEKTNHLALYSPVEKVESHIPPLAEIRETVEQAWVDDQALAAARAEAALFIKKAADQGWQAAVDTLPEEGEVSHGASQLLPREMLGSYSPLDDTDKNEFRSSIYSLGGQGDISPLTVAGKYKNEPGCFVLYLSEYAKAGEKDAEDPTGQLLEQMTMMAKLDAMFKVWNMGLFEGSKDKIAVPKEFMPN